MNKKQRRENSNLNLNLNFLYNNMTNNILHKLGKNCEICGGASRGRGRGGGECKGNEDFILCITGKELGCLPSGWKYLKDDSMGVFGIFVRDRRYNSDNSEWEEQKRRRDWKKNQTHQGERFVGIDERHEKIGLLLNRLRLTEKDRQSLLARGMSEEEIREGGYRSVSPNMNFGGDPIWGLFGIGAKGTKLLGTHTGILCPFKNQSNKWVGWQLRLLENISGGKYRWPVNTKTKHNDWGLSVHLELNKHGSVIDRNSTFGEIEERTDSVVPLAFYDGNTIKDAEGNQPKKFRIDECLTFDEKLEKCKQGEISRKQLIETCVGLAEGTAFKPFLTASRLNCLTIGAAGGNFVSNTKFFLNRL